MGDSITCCIYTCKGSVWCRTSTQGYGVLSGLTWCSGRGKISHGTSRACIVYGESGFMWHIGAMPCSEEGLHGAACSPCHTWLQGLQPPVLRKLDCSDLKHKAKDSGWIQAYKREQETNQIIKFVWPQKLASKTKTCRHISGFLILIWTVYHRNRKRLVLDTRCALCTFQAPAPKHRGN